jgi:energy-coupling factor transport system substrate-specific component
VSWQVASFAFLAVVLVGGFAWYERSRPPSRIVAMVAALAALAVAGRVVLAPVPNVVATTDVVLLTGYAVGAAPGFAVGALAAVISNFWLGQGPWTPWQMAGWGLVGIGGAALAAFTGRRLGRIGLAAACGIAGLAYGALLDLSVMVSYGGEQSLDRYLALSARGVPFNIAHAAGNVALALVAGPALVRMLLRFRARTEFRWRHAPGRPGAVRGGAGVAAVSILATLVAAGALAGPLDGARAGGGAGGATAWLERAQNADGGFGSSPGADSNAAMTGWAMLGLEAAARNPLDIREDGRSPVDFLRKRSGEVRSVGDLERTILALVGAGANPRDFAGRDLVAELRKHRSPDGSYPGGVNPTAFGILALRAAGDAGSSLSRSARWLRGAQNPDGGWGFRPDAASDPDSTGAALQGLAAAGGGGTGRGVDYLRGAQEGDGGWSLVESGPSNSQSTAWAVQGLLAAGVDPGGVESGGRDPFEFLAARQAADGHYRYSASSDQTPVWVTTQALAAVAREPFPLDPVPRTSGEGGSGSTSAGTDGGGGAATGAPTSGGGSSGTFPSAGESLGDAGRGSGATPIPGGSRSVRPEDAAPPPEGPGGSDPPTTPAPSVGAEQVGDEEDAPYAGIGAGVLATVLGLGFFWIRDPLGP